MDTPAQTLDLEARGYTIVSEAVAQTRLDESWRALRREIRSIEADIASGAVDTADVVDVVSAAALRILRNPDGHKQEAGSLDDYAESWTRADSTLDLYFTAAELNRLRVPSAFATGFVGSIKYL